VENNVFFSDYAYAKMTSCKRERHKIEPRIMEFKYFLCWNWMTKAKSLKTISD